MINSMREITLPKKYAHRDNTFEKMVGIRMEREREDGRYRERKHVAAFFI